MKRLTVILSIAVVLIFSLASCEKDINGIPVKYYENVTGEGYVFEKHNDGTITPHKWIGIQAREKQCEIGLCEDIDNYYHVDHPDVDNNGKYTCRFLEKKRPNVWIFGEWKKMSFYTIFTGGVIDNSITYTSETIQAVAKKATKKNPQVIHLDTVFINVN